jgi:hypothetical protein
MLTSEGSFAMLFTTEPGRLYRVEYTTNLLDWLVLTNFISTGPKMQLSDPAPTGSTLRYYRLATEDL